MTMTSQKGLLVRLLESEDAQALAALEARVFADPWSVGRFAELLGQDRFLAVGAFDARGLCAYLTAYSLAGELEIVNVAVDPALRGQGLGTRLLHFFLDHARVLEATRAVLEVRAGNIPALALYRGRGFEQIGLRRGYYTDTGEDALVLAWTAPAS